MESYSSPFFSSAVSTMSVVREVLYCVFLIVTRNGKDQRGHNGDLLGTELLVMRKNSGLL
jgi:hypothetical protein